MENEVKKMEMEKLYAKGNNSSNPDRELRTENDDII